MHIVPLFKLSLIGRAACRLLRMTPLPLLLRRLGQVIRTLRTQAGYSQDGFGSAVGVHRTYMGLVERGLANPTLKVLHGVAHRLGISVLELFRLAMIEDSAVTTATEGQVHQAGRKKGGGKRLA